MVNPYKDEPTNEYGWRECWGVKFKWTPEHLTPKELEPLTRTYDTIATTALERLDEISPPSSWTDLHNNVDDASPREKGEKQPRRDIYGLVQRYGTADETIGRLWGEITTIPAWVDWEQIERGQKVFYRYGGPAITALTFLSLLGGMGSGRTVETLDRTGGFSVEAVRRRLLETVQHTLNVTRDLESIKPGGDGFADSVRVRLLHAAVRRRIMRIAETTPEYYDMNALGVPVNDLDCIGTINTFSTSVVWMGLPRQGIWLRKQEIRDYLALWRYIAYLMGTPHEWMSTPESARRMMESLLVSEIQPSKASANLANNIISGIQAQPPVYLSREYLCAQTYWLIGSQLSEALAIERPSLYYFALVLGQYTLLMALCYVNRSFRYLDERNINLLREALPKVLLHNKSRGGLGYTTKFHFKYIPSLDRPSTARGLAPATDPKVRKKIGRIERTPLITLLVPPTLIITALALCCFKGARWAGC
ncbi:hypothetical protein GGR54DRAFT_15421 [Hypoxylon sp. NC1633]|nr:hypothetical protein GGR54DRAFT_15421 [Hypoxylon sp. NC1633]